MGREDQKWGMLVPTFHVFQFEFKYSEKRVCWAKAGWRSMALGDKAQSTVEEGYRASKQVRRAQSSLKPNPLAKVDLGWKRGDILKGPFSKLGQDLGGKQPISVKGSLRRKDFSAKGKEKVGSEVSEAQLRGSALKCGSKKLWNALFPPSSGSRRGIRRSSEPLTLEKSSLDCDVFPKEDAFEAGTQLERRFSGSQITFSHSSRFRKGCSGEGTSSLRGNADNHQRFHLKSSIA